jgi:hypothetical protein
MPGMFICACCGEGPGFAAFPGDAEGFGMVIPGISIPGMLPIWFLLAEFFVAGAFFLLDTAVRRCLIAIFIPGMFIPGMLLMSCFFGDCVLFRTEVFFRRDARFRFAFVFVVDLGLDIFIPGMFWPSCEDAAGPVANEIKIQLTKNRYL